MGLWSDLPDTCCGGPANARECKSGRQVSFDKQNRLVYTEIRVYGRIAQLGERFPYTEEVTGSSPVSPTSLPQDAEAWCSLV